MPLNARNAFELAGLAPGVQFTARGKASTLLRVTANSGTSSLAMAGGQPRYNEALLDGVPNTGSDGLIQYVPSLDATQEFKVQTNAFDAEFGRFTGGIINAVVKSGTNDFHGTLWEYLRNSALNARDPFASEQPQFGYNQFGGTAGGPVTLPGIYSGRDRTFFFFNYEGSREGVPRAFVSTVPVEAQRMGDFSQTYVMSAGQLRPVIIYDPATTRQVGTAFVRDPFPANRLPADRIHPVGRNIVSLYPAPNASGAPGTNANNYLMAFKDPVFDNGYLVRVDHRLSDRHQVFARYYWRHFRVTRQGEFKNQVTGDAEDRNAPGFVFDDTYTLNPTTVLNVRLGVARFVSRAAADNLGFDPTRLGFPAGFAAALPLRAIPQFVVSGFTTISGKNKLQRNVEDSYSLRSAATKVKGRHSLRFGGEARVLRSYPGSAGAAAAGAFSFDNLFTRGPNPQVTAVDRGYGLASLLLGLASSGSVVNNAMTAEQVPYYGTYVQDDIRVTRRLTLNLGLRYEWEGENTERFNRFNRGFAFDTPSPLEEKARANYSANPIPELPPAQFRVRGGLLFAGVGGAPRGITNIDRNNWAPRLGAAYAVTRRTVIRGGYGLFYGPTTLMSETRHGFSATTPFVASIDGGLTPYNTLNNPFPQGILAPPGAREGLLTLVGQSINFVYLDRQQPRAQQYQFSLQQELGWRMFIEAAYVGSIVQVMPVDHQLNGIPLQAVLRARQTFLATGRNTLNDSVANPFYGLIESGALSARTTTRGQLLRPYPHFTGLTQLNESIGRSRYDALQLKLEKRLSSGVNFMLSYAAAKQLEQTRFLNDQDTRPVKELASFDVPQRLVVHGSWELPFGPGRKWPGGGSR
ncbi:MAG: TonB-dependent receptor, partial [candidate division KSB1 bacterium]|nr:TonB-dependent receptor [candidate division KSB1 bacterium]